MQSISRKKFLTQISLSTAASVTFPKLGYSSSPYFANRTIVEEYVEVEITHGKIRGVRTDGVNIFKGIPYAGRISGDRRFRRPAPLEPWAEYAKLCNLAHRLSSLQGAMSRLLPRIAFSLMSGLLLMIIESGP